MNELVAGDSDSRWRVGNAGSQEEKRNGREKELRLALAEDAPVKEGQNYWRTAEVPVW
jgi:hypothetical protein